jgi:hypothetical protein
MAPKPDFDTAAAHKYFAAHCFNACWPLIDQPARTVEQAEQLIALGHASLWHWTQRADCTPKNLSIAHWILSRIYAVLGDAPMAQRYAGSCLRISMEGGVAPLFLAFAYEALARAAMVQRDWQTVGEYLRQADEIAEQVTDPEDRKNLMADLKTVRDAFDIAESEPS